MQNLKTHLANAIENHLQDEIGEVKEENRAAVEESITDNFNAGVRAVLKWVFEATEEGLNSADIAEVLLSHSLKK